MARATKPQPGRNFPINRPQFLGENKFMQNTPGTAEHTASPTRVGVVKPRPYRNARFPKVKGMARCAVLFMGLSLASACAVFNPSPPETLEQKVERALPSGFGKPEYVEKIQWYVVGAGRRDEFGNCDDAIALFRDRFVMLRGSQYLSYRYERPPGSSPNAIPSRQVSEWKCAGGFNEVTPENVRIAGSPPGSYRDIQSAVSYLNRGLFGLNTYLELRVPFGPPLSQPGRPPAPRVLVMKLAPTSQIPLILEQRRGH
ncbi:MAG: hypothetical protein ACK5TQ_01985 [Acetobacteraceae bacterium]